MVVTGADANAPFPNQSGAGAKADGDATYMPDRVLVRLKPASASRARLQLGTTSPRALLGISSLDAISAQVGATSARRAIETPRNSSKASDLGLDDWMLIELAPGSDVEAAVAAYGADPNVEVAEPDYIFEPLVTPTDPNYAEHWGHNNTGQFRAFSYNSGKHTGAPVGTVGFDANAEAGWTGPNGFGVATVIIAIIDSGVNLSHPDLTVVSGYDFGDGDPNPEDDSAQPGHGTACAGVAAAKANNGLGACGSAPGCSIMPIKVSKSDGSFSVSAVANGLIWASDHGADIISMSFGLFTHGNGNPLIDPSIDYANAAGVLMLAGTGNNNNALMYPAMHRHVIGVGAASPCGGRKRSAASPAFLDPGVSPDPNNYSCDNERWWGSSFGPSTQDAPEATDILGPTMLPTTIPGGYAPIFNGVSCATPYVAGVAALIKSKHPDWTPAQIRQQLLTSAEDVINVESVAGWDRYSGYGMVDINAATDVTPPSITVVMDRNALWPPNHKMVPCCASITASDNLDADPDVALVSVVSNEPGNARGDGNTVGDIDGADVGTDDRCFDLRSERMGGENGRCYTIVYSATDASSNVAYDTVEVHVPHDQSAAAICSSGFTADGTSLNAGAATLALFVTGSATLEVRRIDKTNLYVGNTAGVIKANDTRVVDINNDQKADLAVFFDAAHAENGTARDGVDAATELDAKTIKDGPVGVHFTLDDGTDYLVRNIYALGAPVAMPSVTGKKTFTPEQQGTTPKTDAAAAAPTEARITALTSIQPNPFNPQTTVHFSLANSERVRISIYDVTGALVRQLVDETMRSGQHQARWDGRSDRGTGVTSGVYFVRMMAGAYREVRKIVMLK
jgi:subtilisin family serine protease